MSTWTKVARYHMLAWFMYAALPWAVLGFQFALYLAGAAFLGPHGEVGAANVASIYIYFGLVGALATFRSLPFAFALGVSRSSYFAGTVLLAVGLAAVDGVALTVLQAIERQTGGWGVELHFFQVPYILAGPWYLTWLTSFVGLALMFVYGMCHGLVYLRWNLLGVLVFGAAQATAAASAAMAITRVHAWPAIGHLLAALTAAGLTGLLAALTVALFGGAYATIRRVTV